MIELKNIFFAYDGKQIFDNYSICFEEGSRTAILGKSGIGKTTLINLLLGLAKPQSGVVSGVPQSKIGMVFQEDRLIPSLTVSQNISIATGASDCEVTQMLAELELAGTAALLPRNLSGGMSRRVAIARALLTGAELIIMDEPFKGLDDATLSVVASTVNRHSLGKTLIIITHSRHDAELLGCNILELTTK